MGIGRRGFDGNFAEMVVEGTILRERGECIANLVDASSRGRASHGVPDRDFFSPHRVAHVSNQKDW